MKNKLIEVGHKITFRDGTVLVCREVNYRDGFVYGRANLLGGSELHYFWGRFRWSRKLSSFVQF